MTFINKRGLSISALWSVVLFGLILTFLAVSPAHVSALTAGVDYPAGINGYGCGVANPTFGRGDSTEQAAGLVVNVQWVPYGATAPREDHSSQVKITTSLSSPVYQDSSGNYHKTGGAGRSQVPGVMQMQTDDGSPPKSTLLHDRFSQVNAGCQGMDWSGNNDNWGVVLGYGKTSPDGALNWNYWALDCLEAQRTAAGYVGNDKFQPYDVEGLGTPTGARSGGTWTTYVFDSNADNGQGAWVQTETVTPVNGTTVRARVVYTEPAPPPPPQTVCTYADVSNRNEWWDSYANRWDRQRTYVHISGVGVSRFKNNTDPWQNVSYNDISQFVPSPDGTNPPSSSISEKQWQYWPNANTIHSTIQQQALRPAGAPGNSTGGWAWITVNTVQDSDISCFSATCSITYVDGDQANPVNGTNPDGSPHHIVTTNGSMSIHGTFTNTSPYGLPMYAGAYLDGPNGTNSLGFVPYPGSPVGFEIDTVRAPPTMQTYNATFTPQYNASESNMTGCPMSVPVYQQFDLMPHATVSLSPTNENPTQVANSTWVNENGPAVSEAVTSKLYEIPYGGSQTPKGSPSSLGSSGPFGAGNTCLYQSPPPNNVAGCSSAYNGTYSPSPPTQAGDLYCAEITVPVVRDPNNPNNGPFVGPGGDVVGGVSGTPYNTARNCQLVSNEPYVHVTGTDVMAGGGFGNGCSNDTANDNIRTFINDTNEKPSGSGTQFGAQALGVIEGFGSSNLLNTTPTQKPARALTFANDSGVIGTAPGNPTMGGNFDPARPPTNSYCVPDYYGTLPGGVPKISAASASVGANGTQWYKAPAASPLKLLGGSIADGTNEAIYVDGDVYINDDIKYANTSWGSVANVPSFYLIVKGNIYIDPGVKQLDGVYVAQPNGAGKGIINTCSSGPGTYNITQIYSGCKNQLVINGAFVARQIFLDRGYSSLRYSKNGENILGGFGSHVCGLAGNDVPSTGPTSGADCAAEIFNFSPELYLTHPSITPYSGPTYGKYDDITSLSPVL